MKDIEITVQGEEFAEKLRTITPANVGWLLGAGWMFYFVSLLLNLVYYLMHPSSPEMWTWGAAEELEEWTPPEEAETRRRRQTDRGPKNQIETSQTLLVSLL